MPRTPIRSPKDLSTVGRLYSLEGRPMSIRTLIVSCMLLALLSPFADAKTRRNKIPKNAKYSHITGAKHFKYKPGKKQKLKSHKG
jgi:hypothetical protein